MGTGYERPGRGIYVHATRVTDHGDLTVERGFPGSAIKQQAYASDSARGVGRRSIAIGERFFLRTKGICEAETGTGKQGNALAAAQIGDPVYITTATGVLATTSGSGKIKLGPVVEIPGVHGCPPGIVRIDLDQRSLVP